MIHKTARWTDMLGCALVQRSTHFVCYLGDYPILRTVLLQIDCKILKTWKRVFAKTSEQPEHCSTVVVK